MNLVAIASDYAFKLLLKALENVVRQFEKLWEIKGVWKRCEQMVVFAWLFEYFIKNLPPYHYFPYLTPHEW